MSNLLSSNLFPNEIPGSTSVANTETTLFIVKNVSSFMGGWILLPAAAVTWTLRYYVPSTATSAWHTLSIAGSGTSTTLVKVGASAIAKLSGTVQDVKVTAQSNSTTAYTINWVIRVQR